MVDIARGLGVDYHLAGFVAVLLAHTREQVSELVILLLGPFLQWMIVAPRAGEPLSHERLRYILRQIYRVLVQNEIVQSAVLAARSARREDFRRELIPRLVLLYGIADPVIESPHRVGTQF